MTMLLIMGYKLNVVCIIMYYIGIILTYPNSFQLQKEREIEEKQLQDIMEENNKKILEAQRNLVS